MDVYRDSALKIGADKTHQKSLIYVFSLFCYAVLDVDGSLTFTIPNNS